jgi:adenine phosphoribosyltransferase
MDLKAYIRDVPDFPKPGILFRDLSPLVAHPDALRESVERLADFYRNERVTKVVGIESRGFVFGAPVAIRLGAGFVPVRKPGKLPRASIREAYDLEYGSAALELHEDAVQKGDRVLVVDDLIATGGTTAATVALVRRLGAEVVGCAFVVELLALGGRRRLDGVRAESLVRFS